MPNSVPESPKDPMTEPLDPSTPADGTPPPDTRPPPRRASSRRPRHRSGHRPHRRPRPSSRAASASRSRPPSSRPPRRRHPPASSGGGYGKWLIAVLIPVIAVVTFAGGVAAGRGDLFGAEAGPPRPPRRTPATRASTSSRRRGARSTRTTSTRRTSTTRSMAYGAIRGMTDAVGDEGHTSFLTADEAKAMDQSLSGDVRRHRRPGERRRRDRSHDQLDHPQHARGGVGRAQARRQDHRGRRLEDRGPHDGRGRLARPRPRGRARDADPRPRGHRELRRHDHPPQVRPAARVLGDGPGPRRGDDPARAVRDGRHEGGPGRHHRGQGGRGDGDHPRPPQQPRRLRQRGDRRRQPVRRRRHRLPEPGRVGQDDRRAGRGRRPVHRGPARGPRQRRLRQLGGDRHGRDPGRRSAAPWWGRRRSGRAPSSAGSTSPTARRCGSASSAGSPAAAARSGTRASSPTSRSCSRPTTAPLLPDELQDISAAELAKSPDAQVLKALQELKGEG